MHANIGYGLSDLFILFQQEISDKTFWALSQITCSVYY